MRTSDHDPAAQSEAARAKRPAGKATTYLEVYSERPLPPKAKRIDVLLGMYSPGAQVELDFAMEIDL